jgi:glycosyltransferase involved in cell wall biosynthesis
MTGRTSANPPLVSVCLPNLNTFRYLQERVNTILGQTYPHWEMIVVDSFSDDGSWEFFQELARKDQRISIAQAPRGLYASWNNCIQRAQGKYVYIATSDDTMASDCLEKLVAALEEHDDCDLAHCSLLIITQDGAPLAELRWPDITSFACGNPEMLHQRHLRRAPYDGLLHLTGKAVYLSITQLLIRRTLFSRIGDFESRWGSMGDRNWEMKAGLVSNTIHVPNTWASWRVHPAQGTSAVDFSSLDYAQKVGEMIQDAVLKCEPHLAPEVVAGLKGHWLGWSSEMRAYYRDLRNRPNFLQRRLFQVAQLGRKAARAEMIHQLRGGAKWPERAPEEIRKWLDSLGLGPAVVAA